MGPMDGIRVIEVAIYVFGPGAGAVMADWGADVVKVEDPRHGDPSRHLSYRGIDPGDGGFTFQWEIHNRGKRSIGINLQLPQGQEIFYDLIKTADVFLTNLRTPALRKMNIEPDMLLELNRRLVYMRATGYGLHGDEADKGGYDGLTYWYRSGAAIASTPTSSPELVNLPGPAFGDIQGAMSVAGGIAAGLFQRERTGKGVVVDHSLFGQGIWAMQASLVGANMLGVDTLAPMHHSFPANPLVNEYRTADNRWLVLAMLQADRYWVDLCNVLGRPDLAADPRFTTMDLRRSNNKACVDILDEIFASQPLDHWKECLSKQEGQWEVVRNVGDLNTDAQAWDNGYLQKVDYGDGRSMTMVPAPVHFDGRPGVLSPAPELGSNTEEILLELGRDWDDIVSLKDSGAIS